VIESAEYSVVLSRPATEVWAVVRDFNSYPKWVDGVEESHIEDGLSGTAVGAVRNFTLGGARTRQRLVAHSDADHFFTYESCVPLRAEGSGATRTLWRYRGTLRLHPVTEGGRCFTHWSTEYDCPPEDAEYWSQWWVGTLPTWLHSLRDHLGGRSTPEGHACRNPFGVQDVPDPDGDDVTDFARGVRLAGAADDDNAVHWDGPTSLEGTWSSRWRGEGMDWQQGHGTLTVDGDRIYVLFDWADATGQGLIEARRDGPDRLVGRYLNLSAPEITRPWVGRIVDATRIDGAHSGGRIDFRR